ncbi:MAG: hypothetical protein ACT4OE_07170 [Sphingosinicella sp.]
MDLITGLAAATNGIAIAKALRQVDKNMDAATYKTQIAGLIETLTDARLALVEAKQTIAERDQEIKRLKEVDRESAKLIEGDGNYRYFPNSKGERSGFPICPRCENLDSRLVRFKAKCKSRCCQVSCLFN